MKISLLLLITILIILYLSSSPERSFIWVPFSTIVTDGIHQSKRIWFSHKKMDGNVALKWIQNNNHTMIRPMDNKPIQYIDTTHWVDEVSSFINACITVAYSLDFRDPYNVAALISTRKKTEKKSGVSVSMVTFTFDPSASYIHNARAMKHAIEEGKKNDSKSMKAHEIIRQGLKSQIVFNNWVRYNGGKYWVLPEVISYHPWRRRWSCIEVAESPQGWYVRINLTFPRMMK